MKYEIARRNRTAGWGVGGPADCRRSLRIAEPEEPPATPFSFRGQTLQARPLLLGNVETVAAASTVEVPEVRGRNGSRSISIGYTVVPGADGAGDIPLVMLAGGPGGSHIRNLDSGWVKERIALFRRVGDVIMVDLRGIHSSTPNFEVDGPADRFRVVDSSEALNELLRDAGAAGRERLLAEGFDLSGYVVTEAAADVMAVVDTLGYGRINVFGTSFGSHFTFAVVRANPDRVNRFFVTGLEGYDHTYDDGAEVLKAVRAIAGEAERVWDGAHGHANPLEAMQALAADARSAAATAHGLLEHEVVGSMTTGDYLLRDYRLSSRVGMARWPADVASIMSGDGMWRMPFVRRVLGFVLGGTPGDAAVGLFDCSSHISPQRAVQLGETAPAFYPNDAERMAALCAGWGVAPLPESFQLGEGSDVTGLFLHGTYDVSTPYANALQMLVHFPNAQLVTITGGSHNAFSEVLVANQSFGDDVVRWLQGGAAPSDFTLGPIEFVPLME